MAESERIGLQDLLAKLIKDTFSTKWDDGLDHEGPLPIQDVQDIRFHYERLSGNSWYYLLPWMKEWIEDTWTHEKRAEHDLAVFHLHVAWTSRLLASLDELAPTW